MAWSNVEFGSLYAAPTRNGLNRPKAVRGEGVPMVNMGELFAYDRIGDIDMDRVSLSGPEWSKSVLEPGDLLFARQSLVLSGAGKCSIFEGAAEPVTFESHITRVRLDKAKADPLFFYYLFKSHAGRAAIESIVEQGAGAAGIRGSDLGRLEVLHPPLDEQHRIAHILGTLDDKIEVNRRMNETLEEMARALFKSWFVDFDPVRAKDEGRDPGLPEHLANLFPDRLVDSELGEVPLGWGVARLGDLIEFAYGKPLKADVRRDGPVVVVGANGPVGHHDERLVAGPGVVVGRKGTPGVITWIDQDFYPIDTTFYVQMRSGIVPSSFIFHLLVNANLQSLSADSAVPGLNRSAALGRAVFVPPTALPAAFDRIAEVLRARQHALSLDTMALSAMRDALLNHLFERATSAVGGQP